MPKIDIAALKTDSRTGYPEPFRQAVQGRSRKRLGDAVGLDQFGVNLTTLKPGAASSQRHWHANEDELVYVLAGEVVLCEDGGETVLRPGDAAGWKAGVIERADYPDIDMRVERDDKGMRYLHKSGAPYPGSER
jgi:uncharacterized cupin superfamily protein